MCFLLDHRLVGRVHIQLILHHRRVDARHLLRDKGTNVLVFPQESNQGVSDVITHLTTKLNYAVRPPFIEGDGR